MTHDTSRPTQYARSLLSLGESLTLERYEGTGESGGYHVEQYADPEEITGLLRPGEIDAPYVDAKGRHGTADWWLIVASADDVSEQDWIRRSHTDTQTAFEVSVPMSCPIHGVDVFQLDERADGRNSATDANPDA